jgi:hypothetical protein
MTNLVQNTHDLSIIDIFKILQVKMVSLISTTVLLLFLHIGNFITL